VTIPVEEVTVPTAGTLLLQVPPMVAFVSVVVRPVHTVAVPAMIAGNG
jgi:hypothetical protein